MPLEDDDLRYLEAAQGYVVLGLHLEANAELEQIDAFARHVPEVLRVRLAIYRALEKWEAMQAVAKRLSIYDPDDVNAARAWAFATRRADCIEQARLILREAVERLPLSAALHYDLACAECQLGDAQGAMATLAAAFKLDPGLRLRALDDADLAPVWQALRTD